MMNIVCSTDPISGRDLFDLDRYPFTTDRGAVSSRTIYFESGHNTSTYLLVPTEYPTGGIPVDLDHPTEEY